MKKRDLYTVLGVSKSASKEEIKAAYRALALRYHPDRNAGSKKAEEQFKEIVCAYEVLSNSEKRTEYDQPSKKEQNNGTGNTGYDSSSSTLPFSAILFTIGFIDLWRYLAKGHYSQITLMSILLNGSILFYCGLLIIIYLTLWDYWTQLKPFQSFKAIFKEHIISSLYTVFVCSCLVGINHVIDYVFDTRQSSSYSRSSGQRTGPRPSGRRLAGSSRALRIPSRSR